MYQGQLMMAARSRKLTRRLRAPPPPASARNRPNSSKGLLPLTAEDRTLEDFGRGTGRGTHPWIIPARRVPPVRFAVLSVQPARPQRGTLSLVRRRRRARRSGCFSRQPYAGGRSGRWLWCSRKALIEDRVGLPVGAPVVQLAIRTVEGMSASRSGSAGRWRQAAGHRRKTPARPGRPAYRAGR